MNIFNLNHYLSIFQLPKRIEEPLSWIEHIPFAWFLITILKPRTFVELGVHTGNSYNAFCQAVKMAETNTKCYGIDTWRGDKHAEFYEETVFQKLLDYHQQEYNEYSHLLKMTFDEAQGHFADHTIDLLHIDGFHTYEAVRHDFDHWLPKLSERGVVILHDTEVKERDFGVWQLWQEISTQYPTFNFTHGYGLGIVAVGNQVPSEFLEFLQTAQQEVFYQHLFARLGRYISLSERNKKLETLAKKQGLGLTYSAQLFMDTGTGFSEPQSIVKTLTGDEQTLEFDVSEYNHIKQLRFDPLSTLMTLHLQRIILVDDQKQSHIVSDFRDNAFTRSENNILIFDVEDPQIYIDVPNIGHLLKVIFLLDYLTIGSETLKSVLTVEREKIQQLDPYHSLRGYVVQLFLDIGNDFSEEHCLRRLITGEEPQLEFDLSGYETIKRLRFDPLNAPVIIRLHQIVVYDLESQPHDMTRYETNAYAPPTDDHTLVFDTEDSQIHIDLEGFSTPTKIVFSLEYVTLGSPVLDSVLQLERERVQTLEQQTQQLGQQVQLLQQQKNSLEYLLPQHQPSSKYMAQLYLDTGAGFSETQALLQEVILHKEAQVFEFDLSGYENLKQLRFDPLNLMTALRIEQIVVVDGQGLTHRLNYQPVNAYAQLGEILVFDTEDSQILITWPKLEKPQKVVIQLHYVAMGTNTYRIILQREREILKQQGEQIRYLTQLVRQLRA